MKMFKLLPVVVLFFLSCESEEYKKVESLPKNENSISEMVKALESGNLSEKEYIKISTVIDNIYFEAIERLPNDESSLLEINEIREKPGLSEAGYKEISTIIDNIYVKIVEELPINESSLPVINEILEKPDLSESGKNKIGSLLDDFTDSLQEEKRKNRYKIESNIEKDLKDNGLNSVNNMINESFDNNEIDQDSRDELLVLAQNKYKSIQEEDKKLRGWSEGYYVDSFGDRTGETFTRKKLNGTFSNSATNNSELGVDILFDIDSIDFRLYEYGFDRGVEKEFLDSIYMKMRNEKDEDLEIFIYRKTGSGKISAYFSKQTRSSDFYSIVGFFERSEEVRVRISAGASYSFTVDTKYFNVE